MSVKQERFWKETPLELLNRSQWEALCDRCGKCCLHRFEDPETHEILFTNVCCRYLDTASGNCLDYPNRARNVPDCVTLTPEMLQEPHWLPQTCAYRLLAEHKELPGWHPLVSGRPETLFNSGHSVGGRVISELDADELEHHLVDWIR